MAQWLIYYTVYWSTIPYSLYGIVMMERITVSCPLMISLDVGFRPWLEEIPWFRVGTALGRQRISTEAWVAQIDKMLKMTLAPPRVRTELVKVW